MSAPQGCRGRMVHQVHWDVMECLWNLGTLARDREGSFENVSSDAQWHFWVHTTCKHVPRYVLRMKWKYRLLCRGAFIPDVQILITTLRHICFANISNSDSKFHLDLTEWRVETKLLKERASTRDSIPRHLSCNPLRLKTLQPQNKKPGQSLTWRHWLNNRDGPHPGWFAAQLVANETEAKPRPLRVKRSGYQRQAKGVHNRKCTRRITNKSAHTHTLRAGMEAQTDTQMPQPACHLSADRRNTPATSSQSAFHHSVTTCQLQSPSLRHTALIFTNCAAAWDTTQPCQKYDTGRITLLHSLAYTQTHTHTHAPTVTHAYLYVQFYPTYEKSERLSTVRRWHE